MDVKLFGKVTEVIPVAQRKTPKLMVVTPKGISKVPRQSLFKVTALFTIAINPEVPQATSPLPVPLSYSGPIPEALGAITAEDKRINKKLNTRTIFFIFELSS